MEKSSIGRIMLSARGNSYGISVEGGNNLVIDGVAFDAPGSQPTSGKQLAISGGTGIRVTNCSFWAGMANPSAATGGVAQNRGNIHVTGGQQIVIDGNNFRGTSPVLYTGSNVGAKQVKWGLSGYPTNPSPRIEQYRNDQVADIDPTVALVVAP